VKSEVSSRGSESNGGSGIVNTRRIPEMRVPTVESETSDNGSKTANRSNRLAGRRTSWPTASISGRR
jgi:hypothetical protein